MFTLLFTMFCIGYEPGEGVVVVDSDKKTATWGGSDYITEVEYYLNDSMVNKVTGDSGYWFDAVLNYFVVDSTGLNVTLNLDVEPNAITDILTSPSLLDAKVASLSNFTYMSSKITQENLTLAISDLSDIPVTAFHGGVSKEQPIQLNGVYDLDVSLSPIIAGTHGAIVKLGRGSWEFRITTYQNWLDNTLTIENIQIVNTEGVIATTGYIELDNDNVATPENWWDSDWEFRKPITISLANPDNELMENYTIKFNLDDSAELEGEANADFSDLRFLEDQNSTVLDYWIEDITGDNATLWVERQQAWDNVDNIIYVYYGNSGASVYENGENTFRFFDEADQGLDTNSKWTDTSGGRAFHDSENDMIRLRSTGSDELGIHSQSNFQEPFALEFDIENIFTNGFSWFGIKDLTASTASGAFVRSGMALRNSGEGFSIDWYDTTDTGFTWNQGEPFSERWGTVKLETVTLDVKKFDNDRNDDDNWADADFNTGLNHDVDWKIGFNIFTQDYRIDNIIVRKYLENPPTISLGALETVGQRFENVGEWVSVNWQVFELTTVENFIVRMGQDARENFYIGGSVNPFGFTFNTSNLQWYVVTSAPDNVVIFNEDWSFNTNVPLTDTDSAVGITRVGFNYYIADSASGWVDNYVGEGFTIIENFNTELSTGLTDIEYFDGDFYVLNGTAGDDRVRRYDGDFSFVQQYTLDQGALGNASAQSLVHDGDHWNVLYTENSGFPGTHAFTVKFDNDFDNIGWSKDFSAHEASARGLYSDNENLYLVGIGTDTVLKYDPDNGIDNIYYRIGVSIDNDNTIENYQGWIVLPDNGIVSDFSSLPDGYTYNVSFRLETDNNLISPRVSAFFLLVDFAREWISAENWSDNFDVEELIWISAENWDLGITIGGQTIIPQEDLSNMLNNVLIPLIIIFVMAIPFGNRFGRYGFLGGMMLGVIVSYVSLGFPLELVILTGAAIVVVWVRGDG